MQPLPGWLFLLLLLTACLISGVYLAGWMYGVKTRHVWHWTEDMLFFWLAPLPAYFLQWLLDRYLSFCTRWDERLSRILEECRQRGEIGGDE